MVKFGIALRYAHKMLMGDNLLIALGIPWTASQRDLLNYFNQFGTVEDIQRPFDGFTRMPKSFAIIQYSTKGAMQRCLSSRSHEIDLHSFKVDVYARNSSTNGMYQN
ncbi:hypothetical protein GJ496_008888 [Pomphorhynchus laevis]|nr:hypothetical protein GJ496_008888 [Pomphorhynchus laevis]